MMDEIPPNWLGGKFCCYLQAQSYEQHNASCTAHEAVFNT